jgi:hypothetical protein
MKNKINFLLIFLLIFLNVCNKNNEATMNSKYEIGQVWSYKTRSNEQLSKIYIVKIDKLKNEEFAYHIFVDNLHIKNNSEQGFQTSLPHLPVSRKTLDESVTDLVNINRVDMPDISEGYEIWKKDNGGIFTIPVENIIKIAEENARQ